MITALAPLLLAAVLAQEPAPIDTGLTVTAMAGLNGLYRPGRWTPVQVDLDTRSAAITGEIVVEWGRARLRRALVMGAPSRQHFDLYIRAGADARDRVSVRVMSDARELASVDVPIRRVGEEDVVVCLTSANPDSPGPTECTAQIPADSRLPRSWRAYDAADRVLWISEDSPPPELDGALRFHRALRRVEDAGNAAPSAGAVPASRDPGRRAQLPLIAYIATLAAGAGTLRRLHASPAVFVASLALVIGAGSAVALAAGRASPIIVHHATVVEQFAGTDRVRVAMRGLAEYPANGVVALRSSFADGAFEVGGTSEVRAGLDSDGVPVLEGMAHLGSSTRFTLETTGAFRALDVTQRNGATRLVNASSINLRGCGFSWEEGPRQDVPPGAGLETRVPPGGADPLASCTFEGAPLSFRDGRHAVVMDGITVVAHHIVDTSPGQRRP